MNRTHQCFRRFVARKHPDQRRGSFRLASARTDSSGIDRGQIEFRGQQADQFDARRIANYDDRKVAKLLADPGIVRNRLKIAATIRNATAFLEVQKEFGTFDKYLWQFIGGKPRQNAWNSLKQVPAKTPESDAMSKDLLKRGFKFVGSTICYALMQAVGMVNDHPVDCFRHAQVARLR